MINDFKNSFQSNVDKTVDEQTKIQDISLNGNSFSQKNIDKTIEEQLLIKDVNLKNNMNKTIVEQLASQGMIETYQNDDGMSIAEKELVNSITARNKVTLQTNVDKTIEEQLLISEISTQKQNSQANVDAYIKLSSEEEIEPLTYPIEENPLYMFLMKYIEQIKSDIIRCIQRGAMSNNPYLFISGNTHSHSLKYRIIASEIKDAYYVAKEIEEYLNRECQYLDDGVYHVEISYTDYAPKQANSNILNKQGYYMLAISLKQKQKIKEK